METLPVGFSVILFAFAVVLLEDLDGICSKSSFFVDKENFVGETFFLLMDFSYFCVNLRMKSVLIAAYVTLFKGII